MVQNMIDELTSTLVDAAKHDKGNSAAGTRVRKAMQDSKASAQAVRVQVQNDKNNWIWIRFWFSQDLSESKV